MISKEEANIYAKTIYGVHYSTNRRCEAFYLNL